MVPQEIYHEIVAHLRHSRPDLRNCALSGRFLANAAQRYLFSHVIISNWSSPQYSAPSLAGGNSAVFDEIVRASPHICAYVEHIVIIDYRRVNTLISTHASSDVHLFRVLPLLKNLKAITFRTPHSQLFIPSKALLDAIIDVVARPTTIYANVAGALSNLVVYSLGPNCKHLCVDCPEGLPTPRIPSHIHPPKTIVLDSLCIRENLESTNRILLEGKTLIDVTKIKTLSVAWCDGTHVELWRLLRSCAAGLEQLVFRPCLDGGWVRGFPPARYTEVIDLAILRNLRRLGVALEMEYTAPERLPLGDMVSWFTTLLQERSAPNLFLEEIMIQVAYLTNMPAEFSSWIVLVDHIVSGVFPRLKKLWVCVMSFQSMDAAEDILKGLRETSLFDPLREKEGFEVVISKGSYDRDWFHEDNYKLWPDLHPYSLL